MVEEEEGDEHPLRVEGRQRVERRQEQLAAEQLLGRGPRDDRPDVRPERPLLRAGQPLDALDRDAAEMEEAQDRPARLRHRERRGERDEQDGQCEHEPAAPRHAAPRRQRGGDARREPRRLGPGDLGAEPPELSLEAHTPPSAARARARSAT